MEIYYNGIGCMTDSQRQNTESPQSQETEEPRQQLLPLSGGTTALSVAFPVLSTALQANCTIIDLSCISAVHPLAAAVAKGCVLLGAGVAQPVNAELDYLPARPAFPAADTEKALFRHDSPFFSLYIDNTSTEIRLSRYCTTAICGPAYSPDTFCGTESAEGRPASKKWR